ncbi:MAG: ArsC/Spx/MgsR family protein [Saprospiraceae bacterium]|nr:arsenate reductase [Lewinella sp.]
MKKIFHLSTCNTCQRIIGELNGGEGFELQDIKSKHINEKELDWLKEQAGSYEALFNRRAMKYRSMGLNEQQLTENDYRRLILEEYTFLKRPVIIIDGEAFIGNAKKTVEAAKEKLGG